MRKDTGAILNEFNSAAAHIYYSITEQFTGFHETETPANEDLRRRQFGHYAYMLKCRLEDLAQQMLQRNATGHYHDQLSHALGSKMNYYLQSFRYRSVSVG